MPEVYILSAAQHTVHYVMHLGICVIYQVIGVTQSVCWGH